MKTPYTARQGQFLGYIHQYTKLHGRPPSEAEMVQFFQITPPSVHQMIVTLERRGLISRTPGQARSTRLVIPPESLPPLPGSSVTVSKPPVMRQPQDQVDTDVEAALVRLGRIQIADLFARNAQNPIDDSEFIPLLDTLIESFNRAGASVRTVIELRRHVCELYHGCCQEADPSSTFQANMELMFSFLPGPVQKHWLRWI